MKISALVLIVISSFTASTLLADPCDTIVTHGLRNISVGFSEETLVASKYAKACSYDFSSMSDTQVASLEVEVIGYGGGDAGYSRQQSETNVKSWCNENKDTAQQNKTNVQNTQTFYQGAVDAWQACIALSARDVFISPRISPDGRTVDLAIVYRGPPSDSAVVSGIPSKGFTCDIIDQNAQKVVFPAKLDTSSVNVHCERDEPVSRQIGSQTFDYLRTGTISVQTSSDPFQLFFIEEYVPLAPDTVVAQLTKQLSRNELPVGSVVASTLSFDDFLRANGPYETSKWVPANGAPLPAGSKYGSISGNGFAPDLTYLTAAPVFTSVVSAPLNHGDQIASLIPADRAGATWQWFAGLRDIAGNRKNNDNEQDVDQFQVYIDNGAVTAQGRTLNWKHNLWGDWAPGSANVLGVSSRPNILNYFVKIN